MRHVRIHTLLVLALTTAAVLVPAPTHAQPPPQAALEAEVAALVLDFYTASTEGDIEFISDFVSTSPEVTFVGSDPSEVFVGHDAIVQWWQGIFDYFGGGLVTLAAGDPVQVQGRGSVVWVVDEGLWRFPGGDVPFRLSLVLILEQAQWKVISGHFSIGVPDTELPL